MAEVAKSTTFSPLPSLMYWSEDLLQGAIRNQNHTTRYPVSFISGSIAAANIVSLPFTLLLDPIIGIFETAMHCRTADSNTVMKNFAYKVVFSPVLHFKTAAIVATVTFISIPVFYLFSVGSAISFNVSMQLPTGGLYIGCLSISYLMHFPTGWYAIAVSNIFDACAIR